MEELSTSTDATCTSTLPVSMAGFSVPSGRLTTFPFTSITHSGRICSAVMKLSAFSGSKRHCTMPVRSRRSTKMMPPWSRRLATQPAKTTSSPTWVSRNSPFMWVRIECRASSI